jgi:hypothetical protein
MIRKPGLIYLFTHGRRFLSFFMKDANPIQNLLNSLTFAIFMKIFGKSRSKMTSPKSVQISLFRLIFIHVQNYHFITTIL